MIYIYIFFFYIKKIRKLMKKNIYYILIQKIRMFLNWVGFLVGGALNYIYNFQRPNRFKTRLKFKKNLYPNMNPNMNMNMNMNNNNLSLLKKHIANKFQYSE
uniref:hypothetical protein n=1 Tax=Hydrocytium acuminatum TaxID=1745963 RepID=UPI002A80DBF2|nr:hypothetical protein UYM18_pgp069 [Hydrocytium acuminatum]WOR09548.1 hypothetical protein [Hydrocytium acuminatum]